MSADTALELAKKIKKRTLSSVELTQNCLNAIKKTDHTIGAYLEVYSETAIKIAKTIDQKIENGEELSPLAGIPIGIKDFTPLF